MAVSQTNHMTGHVHHPQRGNPCSFLILQDETCAQFTRGLDVNFIRHLHTECRDDEEQFREPFRVARMTEQLLSAVRPAVGPVGWQNESIAAHTLRLAAPVLASDGMVSEYIDGIGMVLCRDNHRPGGLVCGASWQHWLWEETEVGGGWPIVGIGASGAAIIGSLQSRSLRRAAVLRAPYKHHGLVYAGETIYAGDKVVLVDDVAVTGESLRYARQWVESVGAEVGKEVVMVDLRSKR